VSALIGELPALGLGSRVTAEVVPTEDGGICPLEEEVFVEVLLLGMEEGNGVDFQGAGIREDAEALRESLVQFGVLLVFIALPILLLLLLLLLLVVVVFLGFERRHTLDLIREDNGIIAPKAHEDDVRLTRTSFENDGIQGFTSTCDVIDVTAGGR